MSYIVFARKYRPKRFDDIIGQEHIVSIIKNGVRNNRIPHAMLFSGPRGVGKTSTARILSMVLNCEDMKDGEPCLTCPSCRSIIEGRDMDVIEIDGASNRGIDEIRDLREKAKYSTVKSRFKIFIIDEIHMLTKEAFNALLKILEEPPKHVIFIFATTEPYNVIPTILSRCQRFDFKRIPVSQTVSQLEFICNEESIEYDLDGLKLISTLADGSLRDATSIIDQLASTMERVTYDNVNIMFGRLNDEFFSRFAESILDNTPKKLIDSLNDILSRGYDLESFVSELAMYIHKLYLIKNNIETEEIEVMSAALRQKAKEQSNRISSEALMQITKELTDTVMDLRLTANKRMIVENQLARIAGMLDSKGIDEIVSMLQGLQKKKSFKEIEETVEPELEKNDDTDIINHLIAQLSAEQFFITEALKMSKIRFAEGDYYEIDVPRTYMKDLNQETLNKILAANKIEKEVKIIFNDDKKYNRIIKNELEENPIVKHLMKSMDSRITNA